MKILSFIIPSFNVEWCLHKALNSMLVQDILQDIEIIVVNDGSTDKTEEIEMCIRDRCRRFQGGIHCKYQC